MTTSVLGRLDWGLEMDSDGNRNYKIKWLVEGTDILDDPVTVYFTAGLPAVGSTWAFGNGTDNWAWCRPDWKISTVLSGEPNTLWIVEQTFSTSFTSHRCQTSQIDNPLNEPDRIGGSFTKFTRETLLDRNGDPVLSSSLEPLRGIQREDNRPNVTIEKNVGSLSLATWAAMVDTLNDATLWGLPARCIKLSNVSWRRLLYGTCSYYFSVAYEFDVRSDTFDDVYQDRGTRVLVNGGTATNPKHFKKYKDPYTGENVEVILNGAGQVWDGTGAPGTVTPEIYGESNFLLLGVPSSLG